MKKNSLLWLLSWFIGFSLFSLSAMAQNRIHFNFPANNQVYFLIDQLGNAYIQTAAGTHAVLTTNNAMQPFMHTVRRVYVSPGFNPNIRNTLHHFNMAFLDAKIDMINPRHSTDNIMIVETTANIVLFDVSTPTESPIVLVKPQNFGGVQRLSVSLDIRKGGILSLIYQDLQTRTMVGGLWTIGPNSKPQLNTHLDNQFYDQVHAAQAPGDSSTPISRFTLGQEGQVSTVYFDNQTLKLRDGNGHSTGSNYPQDKWKEQTKESQTSTQHQQTSGQPRSALDFQSYLSELESILKANILGQPESVAALMSIEMQNMITGENRSKPQVMMLIGLPGTGKDTSFEEYIKARFKLRHPRFEGDPEDHLFRFPVIKEEKDVWSIQGSGTGYIGSNAVSAFNRFLILHSGGKYIIKKGEGQSAAEYVELNPEWKPGMVLEGYYAPEDAVVYINELHDWSKMAQNRLLKEFLEKGYSTIGNPGSGLGRIQVPVTIGLASNHGIGLITARDQDGKRIGAPLNFEQMMENWQVAARDPDRLQKEIGKPTPSNPEGGMTEEIRSRIPKERIVLLRPMSPQTLLEIIKLKLSKLREKFLMPKKMAFPQVELEFSNKLKQFMANYDQLAEDGARSLDGKIDTLIEQTLAQGFKSGALDIKDGSVVKLDVKKNPDGTFSLLANEKALPMLYTLKEKQNSAVSDEEIRRLVGMEEKMNARTKGLGSIIKQLVDDLITAANKPKAKSVDHENKPAEIYAFFGVSSTGKTELAKVFHQIFFQTSSNPLIIDFSQIHTVEDLKAKILGKRDMNNKPIPSDFMQQYDRANGKLVVVLDEISNANPAVLTALYDLLREPVVRTFSDQEARPMGNVKIIMTGNIGEEWYAGIPRSILESQQYEAARKIYHQAMQNAGYRRTFLLKRFTEAFVNRIGENRIFWFAPHTKTTIRELIQMKLLNAMKKINTPTDGQRTWDLKFPSAEDYEKTVQAIETYGFKIWEQGASITKYVDDVLMRSIENSLLRNLVPNGASVNIIKTADQPAASDSAVGFQLVIQSRERPWADQVLELKLSGKGVPRPVRQNPNELRLTAYHEAGHEVVRHVLFRDKKSPGGVTILPGVTQIGGEWVTYDGLAESHTDEGYQFTREVVIAEIAVLAGGEAGELFTTKEMRHTSGKVNDMQRATGLARNAILRWGFSQKWGRASVSNDQDMDKFIAGLSENKKKLLEQEVHSMIEEGRALAKQVLIANYDTLFIPIGNGLAKAGELSGKVLTRFYEKHEHQIVHPDEVAEVQQKIDAFEKKVSAEPPPVNKRDFEFFSFLPAPSSIADVDQMVAEKQAKEVASVDLSPGQKFVRKKLQYSASRVYNILGLLFNKAGVKTGGMACRSAQAQAAR